MTLIVGIKCSDGVVLGADGAATLGNILGETTVTQHVTKLQIIQDRIIMGVSGQVGLSQLYCDRVEGLWRDNKLGRSTGLPDVQRLVYGAIYQDAQIAIAGAAASVPLIGNVNAATLVLTNSLIAIPRSRSAGRTNWAKVGEDDPGFFLFGVPDHQQSATALGGGGGVPSLFSAIILECLRLLQTTCPTSQLEAEGYVGQSTVAERGEVNLVFCI